MKSGHMLLVGLVCLVPYVMPTYDVLSQQQLTTGDTGKSEMQDSDKSTPKNDDVSSAPHYVTGGVEQKEVVTMPGLPQSGSKPALPKFTIEIPQLDKVPPVPKFLQAGATFSEKADAVSAPENVWYRIPNFLAAHWQSTEKTVTSSLNLLTGKGDSNARTEKFISEMHQGSQQDNTGAYWQFANAPFLGHSIGPHDVVHYSFVQLIEPVSCSDQRFVRRSILTKAQVNGAQVVQTSQQVELIQSLTPLAPGLIREDTFGRTFDSQGRAIGQTTSTVVFSMTRPYSPVNRKDGKDMKEMFRQFLENHDMANLVAR
ncbi:MAG TPA: hypothetical protein V6C97_09240 [Oculatellaceae cyanobacterium]